MFAGLVSGVDELCDTADEDRAHDSDEESDRHIIAAHAGCDPSNQCCQDDQLCDSSDGESDGDLFHLSEELERELDHAARHKDCRKKRTDRQTPSQVGIAMVGGDLVCDEEDDGVDDSDTDDPSEEKLGILGLEFFHFAWFFEWSEDAEGECIEPEVCERSPDSKNIQNIGIISVAVGPQILGDHHHDDDAEDGRDGSSDDLPHGVREDAGGGHVL